MKIMSKTLNLTLKKAVVVVNDIRMISQRY